MPDRRHSFASSPNWFSTANPLTQFLPYFSDPEQLAAGLAFNPLAQIDVASLTAMQIDELLIGEKTPLEPTDQIVRTALTWHSMLHAGLRRRNPLFPEARRLYWDAVMHKPDGKMHPFMTPTRGISVQVVKGATGTGKSVTMSRFCSLFPQVIRHGDNSAAGWKAMIQLVYLEVGISHDGSRGGFLTNILTQIDMVLGSSYATDLPKKHRTVDKLAVATVCRLVAHYTGIVFLEEGQLRNLVLSGQADLMQSFLLMLMNSGIPIVFLGNEKAFDWINYSQDTNRLYTTPSEHFVPTGATAIDEASYADAEIAWSAISKGVMDYYIINVPIADPTKCREVLRQCSGGIPRLALFLWCMAQRNVMIFGGNALSSDDITEVYNAQIYLEHRNLADGFTFRKPEKLVDLMDVDVDYYETFWNAASTGSSNCEREPTNTNSVAPRTGKEKPAVQGEKSGKTEKSAFKAEQTRNTVRDALRTAHVESLPDDDVRKSGLSRLHMKGLKDMLDARRGA